MKKRVLFLGSIAFMALLLFNGCSTSDRVENSAGTINDGNSQIADIIVDENLTLPNNQDAQIDNNSSAVIEINADNAYRLDLNLSQEKYLSNSLGQIHYEIRNIYTGQIAQSSAVGDITLTTDGDYAKFIKFNGEEGNQVILSGDDYTSSADVAIKTTSKSGTTNIRVVASILLENGETRPLIASIPLVIEKNRSSSMAIVPVGSRYEDNLFIDTFVIHVVDQYGNKAKDGTKVKVGVINNPKLYTNAANPVNPNGDKAYITTDKDFTLLSNNLLQIDDTDNVIILANEENNDPTILGGWSILENSIDTNSNTLRLFDDYSGVYTSGVSFAIGNDRRYNPCYETLANAAMFTPYGTEVYDGVITVELRYVPYMVGKTVFVYANSKLDDKRIGISRRVNLVGLGLNPLTLTCENSKATSAKSCSQNLFMTLRGSNTPAKNLNIGSPICVSGCGDSWGSSATDLTCSSWTTGRFTVDINKSATYSFGDLIGWENVQNK